MRARIGRLLPLAAMLLCTAPAFAQEQFQKPSVTTTGEAIVYVKPDEVVLSFGVEAFDPSLDKVKATLDAESTKVLKAARDAGAEDKHLQVDTLQIEIRYRGNGRPVNGIEGYVARRSYSATLKDTALLDKVIDAVLKNGANQLHGIEFRSKELRKHRDTARKMAIKAAKEKAELLAGELGAGVGAPRTITEGGGMVGYWGGSNWRGNAFAQNAAQFVPGGGEDGDSANPLGQIAIRASVSVSFDLK